MDYSAANQVQPWSALEFESLLTTDVNPDAPLVVPLVLFLHHHDA
jgi:hypothetical protein